VGFGHCVLVISVIVCHVDGGDEEIRVKLSEFWLCMEHEFGRGYARVLAADLVLGQLGQLTALEALEKGVDPRRVWLAICDTQDIPLERRLGPDIKPSS
jgi:signal transduction histidine kinase